MRQPEAAQNPSHGAVMHVDTVGLGQFSDQFIEGDFALGGDARFDPAGHARELAVPAAIALGSRRERSALAPHNPLSYVACPFVTPIHASREGHHIMANLEILNLNGGDTLWRRHRHGGSGFQLQHCLGHHGE